MLPNEELTCDESLEAINFHSINTDLLTSTTFIQDEKKRFCISRCDVVVTPTRLTLHFFGALQSIIIMLLSKRSLTQLFKKTLTEQTLTSTRLIRPRKIFEK